MRLLENAAGGLENCTLQRNGYGVAVDNNARVYVRDCILRDNGRVCVCRDDDCFVCASPTVGFVCSEMMVGVVCSRISIGFECAGMLVVDFVSAKLAVVLFV